MVLRKNTFLRPVSGQGVGQCHLQILLQVNASLTMLRDMKGKCYEISNFVVLHPVSGNVECWGWTVLEMSFHRPLILIKIKF